MTHVDKDENATTGNIGSIYIHKLAAGGTVRAVHRTGLAAAGQVFHNSAEAGRTESRKEAADNPGAEKATGCMGPGDVRGAGEGPAKHPEGRSKSGECREMAKDPVWEAQAASYTPDTAGQVQAREDTATESAGEDAGLDIQVGYTAEA